MVGKTGFAVIQTWLAKWKHSFIAPPIVFMIINILLAGFLSLIRSREKPELLDQGLLMLNLVANASISIVTLTFSLTVLSVQVASQTYSPRLLDDFVKDPMSKVVISVNLGAYAYCFTLTYALDVGGETPNVPFVAIHFLTLHIIIVLITFVSFIHFFINAFRIENILYRASDASLRAAKSLSDKMSMDLERDTLLEVPEYAYKVMANRSGYVAYYRLDSLVHMAEELDFCVRYNHQIGEFINEGAILCHVWDAKIHKEEQRSLKQRIKEHASFGIPQASREWITLTVQEIEDNKPWMGLIEQRMGNFTAQGISISKKRSGTFDVSLGIQQLSDIAVRALSPGVNDPQTAIQCMDVLSSLLATLAKINLGVPNARDGDDNVRLCAPRRSYSFLLAMLDSLRRYGATDLGVCRRGLRMFGDLGAILTRSGQTDRVPAVFDQLEQWMAVSKTNFDGPELLSLEELYDNLLQVIADAGQLVIKKGAYAGSEMQELGITYRDEFSEERMPAARATSTVRAFLDRVLPPDTKVVEVVKETERRASFPSLRPSSKVPHRTSLRHESSNGSIDDEGKPPMMAEPPLKPHS